MTRIDRYMNDFRDYRIPDKMKAVLLSGVGFNKIEVRVVFDKELKDKEPPNEKIFLVIRNGFKELFGNSIEIDIKEVEKIDRKEKRIITKIKPDDFEISGYK